MAGSKAGSCLPNVDSDGQAGRAEPSVAPDCGGIPVFQRSLSHRPPRQVNLVVRRHTNTGRKSCCLLSCSAPPLSHSRSGCCARTPPCTAKSRCAAEPHRFHRDGASGEEPRPCSQSPHRLAKRSDTVRKDLPRCAHPSVCGGHRADTLPSGIGLEALRFSSDSPSLGARADRFGSADRPLPARSMYRHWGCTKRMIRRSFTPPARRSMWWSRKTTISSSFSINSARRLCIAWCRAVRWHPMA